MKPKERMLRTLEQFSTAMLAALGYLPAAGLVLAAGALLASAGLGTVVPALRWPPLALAGSLAYDGMMAVVQNLSVVFCVGIAAFQARRGKHPGPHVAPLSPLGFFTAGGPPPARRPTGRPPRGGGGRGPRRCPWCRGRRGR